MRIRKVEATWLHRRLRDEWHRHRALGHSWSVCLCGACSAYASGGWAATRTVPTASPKRSSSAGCVFAGGFEYSLGANPLLHDLVAERFAVQDGFVEIPDRPGLGITIDESFVKRYAVNA